MEKIELRIMGGLGNQLYQYSAARFLQLKYGAKQIVIDNGEYETYKIRNLEIEHLLHNDIVKIENIKSRKNTLYREGYHVYQKLYRVIRKKNPKQVLLERGGDRYLCSYIEGNLTSDLNCKVLHMYGYFVSAETALAVKKELMQEIRLEDTDKTKMYREYLDQINKYNSIAVSIRCAEDYIKNNWPICSSQFYQKGIEYIVNRSNYKEEPIILIFADNIRKVKKKDWFSMFRNVSYVEGVNVCESFELMRNCDNYVCSNSSFSWWGAFLSYAKNSIKVNPNKVFSGNSVEVDKLTFYDELTYLDYESGEILK